MLGALYLRIVGTSIECYKYLEPLLNDYRKLKFKNRQGSMWIKWTDGKNKWIDGRKKGYIHEWTVSRCHTPFLFLY